MDNGTYTYLTLAKKHNNFTQPGFTVLIDGKEMPPGKYYITGVEVELSADGSSGGCNFTIQSMYDLETSKWVNDATKLIKPGVKLAVKGGYINRKELFYGYVDEYSLVFSSEGAPGISVSGLDGLGYLMSMCEPIYAGEKEPRAIVQEVLKKSKSAGFAKKITVGQLNEFKTPIIKEQVDDWKFLNLMAQRYGASLMAIDGELIFDRVMTKKTPITTLTIGKGIKYFSKRVSLAHQVGKVEVFGRDINQQPIKGEASNVTVGGSGKTASEWVSGLKSSVLRERTEYAQTQKECERLAQNRLNSISMGFVYGEGECVGIPELIPGRYIKIDGGDEMTNGTYFLNKVRHIFSINGYITSFEVKGAKT